MRLVLKIRPAKDRNLPQRRNCYSIVFCYQTAAALRQCKPVASPHLI